MGRTSLGVTNGSGYSAGGFIALAGCSEIGVCSAGCACMLLFLGFNDTGMPFVLEFNGMYTGYVTGADIGSSGVLSGFLNNGPSLIHLCYRREIFRLCSQASIM